MRAATDRAGYPVPAVLMMEVLLLLVACTPPMPFPPELVARVDLSLTFQRLAEQSAQYRGKTVQLGGQIARTARDSAGIWILVRELPMRSRPPYGPNETARARGMFVFRFAGDLQDQDAQYGNLIVGIGTVVGITTDGTLGAPAPHLHLNAQCFHIWRTQGESLDEFPWNASARPLVQQTYCANQSNLLLPIS